MQEHRSAGSAIAAARSRRDRSPPATGRRPAIASADSTRATPDRGASQGDDARGHRHHRRSAATARGWWQARLARAPRSGCRRGGRSSTSRPCSPSEATALTRPTIKAATISVRARARPRDPGREKHPADADEQPEINADPRQPDQAGNRSRRCPAPRPLSGRGADRKHQRSRDRVSVLRDHAIADDLGAARQVLRQRDDDGLVDGAHRCIVARLARRHRSGGSPPASPASLNRNCTVFGAAPTRCRRRAPPRPAMHARTRRSQSREPTAASPGRRSGASSGRFKVSASA